jgi:hypothetical protein
MVSALLALGGCSGGGGGGMATVTPTPPPPPPTNTSLASLVASQNFANNAATQTATIDTTTENVTAGASTSQALTVAYDVTANSYTITTQGRSQTFAPANMTSAANGIAIFAITNGSTADRLTLESASVTGYSSSYPQYSGLGYWQRTTTGTGSSSDVSVDFFTYGLNSTASQVPRTGQSAFGTSVYGLVTLPGSEARFFQGTGRMDVDFLDGLFNTVATAGETGIQSQTNYGSGTVITGSGTLSSSANALSGTITYGGLNSKSTGTVNGQFYGPAAQELGAAFTTSGNDGSSTSGVIWGNQNSTLAPVNLTIANIVADQSFVSSEAQVPEVPNGAGMTLFIETGEVDVTAAGAITVSPHGLPSVTVTSADKVAGSNANFTAYSQAYGNGAIAVDLYKPGSANTELALTYLTFGSWQGPRSSGSSSTATSWFVYGMGTAPSVIEARSGSANYTGVAYGTAYNTATASSANVNGTASFTVNFDLGGYSGSFGLKNATTNYGTFNATGTMATGTPFGSLTGTTAGSGIIMPAFYGPAAQEFGGPFQITIPGSTTTIVGAVAAKGG